MNDFLMCQQGDRVFIVLDKSGLVRTSDNAGDGEPLGEMIRTEESWAIRDLGGDISILLNGCPLHGRVTLSQESVVSAGDWSWSPPRKKCQTSKGLTMALDSVSREVKLGMFGRKRLPILSDVNLSIKSGEFIGILGPSGSGKSTLLKVMLGEAQPSQGRVVFDGLPLDEYLNSHSEKIAYLPQDPIIHEALTPRAALGYLSQLKGVHSEALVENTLEKVGIADRIDTPICKLSGGERKRVALAATLLADPSAIFLDEATSGLDPGLEKEMMQLFGSLADEGRTVVCITHFPRNLSMCDRLIVMVKGRLDFFGTPDELKAHYGVGDIEDIYEKLHQSGDREQASQTSVASHQHKKQPDPIQPSQNPDDRQCEPVPVQKQIRILLRRYFKVLSCNWGNIILLILQAPVIGLLIGVTFGNIFVDYPEQHAADWKKVAFLLVMSVVWCSGTNGVREIVKERSIFFHERRYGVNETAYILSKFIPLGLIAIAQAVLLLLVIGMITHFAGVWMMHAIILMLLSLAATAMGLLISSAVRTNESAMTFLPVIVIAQGVLSGGLARLEGGVLLFAEVFAPAYWGLCGLKDTLPNQLLDSKFVSIPGEYQPPILGRGPHWAVDIIILIIQISIMLFIGSVLLKKKSN